MAQRERLPNWKIPLSIAAVLHLVVFTSAAVFPDIGKKFNPDNVITIDLLSLPSGAGPEEDEKPAEQPAPEVKEVAEAAEPTPVLPVVAPKKKLKVAPKVTPKVTPKVAPKVVPKIVAKPAASPEPVAQVKPVSLQPVKRKKKLAEDIRLTEVNELEKREKQQAQLKLQQEREQLAALEKKRLAEEQKRKKAAEQEKKLAARKKKQQKAEEKKRLAAQQRKERAIIEAARLARQAEEAAEQARLEAAQVRREYASVAQAVSDLNTPLVSGNTGFYSDDFSNSNSRAESGGYGDHGGERINPVVLNQYAASLNGRISSHWQLPGIVKTKPYLRTMLALTLRRDGSIEDMRIEEKSGDSFFDQSVIKALRNSEPFPGFPALMKQRTQEFVLSFTPQGLSL